MKRHAWLFLLALTALAVGLYIAGLPWLRDVYQWFYQPRDKPIAATLAAMLLGLAVPCGVAAVLGMARRGRIAIATILLVATSYAAQVGLTLAAGSEELWERHALGHSEFFSIAAGRRGQLLETLRDYDDLAWERKLGSFGYTKPPGTYLAYAAIIWLGDQGPIKALLVPIADNARVDRRVAPYAAGAAMSAVLMPLGTALAIVPLVWLGIWLFGRREEAIFAGILYATCPAVLLITYHLDGALSPLLGTGACALAALGARRSSHTASVAAGAVLSLGIYASFSLLPVIALVIGIYLLFCIERWRERGLPFRSAAAWRLNGFWLGWHLLAALAGFFAVLLTLSAALGFDIATRLDVALATHEWWKRGVPTLLWRFMSVVEFAVYAGLPLFAAFVARAVTGAGDFFRFRAFTHEDAAATGMLLFFVGLAATVGTNEVARIWIFVLPYVCLVAALLLPKLVREDSRSTHEPLIALAFCQGTIAIVMKGLQGW